MAKSNVLYVACKLPSGIHLDSAAADAMPGVAPDLASRITLNGTNSAMVNGIVRPDSGGYGITKLTGDQVGFFNDWYATHKDYPPVANGLIFAMADKADVTAEAESRASVLNGTEGANPDKPDAGLEPAKNV